MSTPAAQSLHTAATSQNVTLPPIPQLFDPNFIDVLLPATQSITVPKVEIPEASNAMIDALRSIAHQKLTTNAAPTSSSTLISTLDAFLGLSTGVSGEVVDRFLENAWAEDPVLTLRIIWYTRSIHDGKAEKELFYRAFGWLFENHPRTAIVNLRCLVDPMCSRPSRKSGRKRRQFMSHGYWKDLLNILALATVDELYPKAPLDPRSNFLHNYYDGKSRPAFKNNQEQEGWSRARRVERFVNAHDRLTRKFLDKRYLALYVAVARLFAVHLTKDFATLTKIAALPSDADKKERMQLMHALSLAPKWAPTPGGSHDRVTNITSAICLLVHYAQIFSSIAHRIEFSPSLALPAAKMHLLRCFFQRHVLTPGRRYTCVPEPLMSANRCGATLSPHLLVMQAVELARNQHGSALYACMRGKADLIAAAMREPKRKLAETQSRVVEAQWATLLARVREAGELDDCIAVCDVSGSMGSIWNTRHGKSPFAVDPIWPAISLSLVLARLAKPPFADSFITFSANPQMVVLDPESKGVSLGATVDAMSQAHWGMNTDFNAVFLKLILPLEIAHKVPKDQMIKRVFVFSDMQFDEARSTSSDPAGWKTNHDALVYWNLSDPLDLGITVPVTGEREGVALLSGYSPSLLKVFMDVEEEGWEVLDKSGEKVRQAFTPEEIMRKALSRKSYDGLVVAD
ncbi:hypothetical protein BS17DRAFT_800848 [Gyrodon lividus]|nr:hypothetical protein BS17DRAFT_800848 [Gyrodon lividus]